MELMKSCYYLQNRLNAYYESKAVVIARTKIEWIKFRKREKLLNGRKLSLKMNKQIYQSCVKSAMFFRSKIWCMRENDMILKKK